MSFSEEKLSAFLDGELSAEEVAEIEAAIAANPELQSEIELLMAADALAQEEFDQMLHEPVPFQLAQAIKNAPVETPAQKPFPQAANDAAPVIAFKGRRYAPWITSMAAALAMMVSLGGGYMIGVNQTPQQVAAANPVWLEDIADYHRIYAAQTRHLVEVGADEADHIQTWLTKSVGTDIKIPDLTEHGLTFKGGRLLVAAGKPVSQLMFADADGRIVALCAIQNPTPAENIAIRTIDGFEMVSWGGDGANLVIVGEEGYPDLIDIAETASLGV